MQDKKKYFRNYNNVITLILTFLKTNYNYFQTGVLIGIAIRTGSPLGLNLAEPMWKLLSGMKLMPTDLIEIDKDYVPGNFVVCYHLFL